jgi:hypothetical protein
MISQREARRLRKRVAALEREERERRFRWVETYPGGTHLGTITMPRDWLVGRIEAARLLGHAVVVTVPTNNGEIRVYALPLAEVKK